MTHARSVVLFVLGVTGAFVYVSNAIPQIKTEPAAAATEAPAGIGASPEELVAAGKRIFMSDRAQCLTCHSLGEDPKARCPNQEGLGERAPERRPGMGAAEYLIESIYNPNAYIVAGFPKNQMTPVHKPPIALSHDEILAVVAFLNTLGGKTDATFVERVRRAQAPWRAGLLRPEEGARRMEVPIYPGDAERGRELFRKHACLQCHRVGAEGGDVCPDLSAIGAAQGPEYILESILDPSAVIVRGYKETIVLDEDGWDIRGVAVAWIPDKEHPRALRLSVSEEGVIREEEIDLSKVAQVGDTIVTVEERGEIKVLCGEYVTGDEETGVTLLMLEEGRFVERRIPKERKPTVRPPASPMPANFAMLMTPREIYDLLAYLVAQKAKR